MVPAHGASLEKVGSTSLVSRVLYPADLRCRAEQTTLFRATPLGISQEHGRQKHLLGTQTLLSPYWDLERGMSCRSAVCGLLDERLYYQL